MARRTIHEEFGDVKEHPSYALVSFSRVSGTPKNMFGTDVKHGEIIMMEISEGEYTRSETSQKDHYYNKKLLMRIEMSSMQFAELITTLNVGCGTPATFVYRIDHSNSDGSHTVPDPPQINARERTNRELKEELAVVQEHITELQAEARAILEQKTLKAADRKRLSWLLDKISQELQSNLPYVHKCFGEAVDRTVHDAKAELDSWITRTQIEAGKAALQAPQTEVPMLGEGEDDGDFIDATCDEDS